MRQLPPLNALKAFDAAARNLSFTRAAEDLHVTHGAVSRQIAALENHFGKALFVRGTRTLALTTEGAGLFQVVKQAFDMLRSASAAMRHSDASESVLKVSVPPTLAMWWLMPRLSSLDNGQAKLRIELSTSIEPVDFETGEYDAAIRRITAAPRGLYAERFLDGQSVPVCSPQYRQRNRLNRPDDLARATLLITRTENNAWDAWFRRFKIERDIDAPTKVFDQLYFSLAAAVDSLGVALVPRALVREGIHKGNLCVIADDPLPARRAYALLCPRASPKFETVQAFGSWLRSPVPADE